MSTAEPAELRERRGVFPSSGLSPNPSAPAEGVKLESPDTASDPEAEPAPAAAAVSSVATAAASADESAELDLTAPAPAALLSEISRLSPLIAAFGPRVTTEMAGPVETASARRLYAEIELLRLDFSELPFVERYESHLARLEAQARRGDAAARTARAAALERFHASPAARAIAPVFAQLDELRRRMTVRVAPAPLSARLLSFGGVVIYALLVTPLLLLLVPLRLIHPLLRALGVPTRHLPIDAMQINFGRGTMAAAGLTIKWDGLDNIDPDRSYVAMYSHQSSYDPFVVGASPLPVRLIGKKSLFLIPFLGWLSWAWGHISIDRGNLSKAIKSLDTALAQLRSNGRSLCISPEGTRSPVGRLISFKKGPFHTAMQAKCPVVPILLLGAAELWPSKRVCGVGGTVNVRVLKPIDVVDGDTYQTVRSRVHRAFLKAYAEDIPASAAPISNRYVDMFFFPVCSLLCIALYKYYF